MSLSIESRNAANPPVAASLGNAASIAGWPGHAIWLGLILWAAVWLLALWSTSFSPPVDNAEQLSWVRSLEWGYYKHPPLPTWLLWPWVSVLGLNEWATYLAGALFTCTAVMLARRLVCGLAGPSIANLSLLGTLCIGYYSGRLSYFNHDVVLLLFVVLVATCCWHAFAHRSTAAWLGVGLAIGLGGLAKYQIVLAALSVLTFWACRCAWRDVVHRRGLLMAMGIALLVFAPHALWMAEHDLQPLRYMMGRASPNLTRLQCTVDALQWVANQVVQLLPALLLGGALLSASRRATRQVPPRVAEQAQVGLFLVCFGLLPLLWMGLAGVLFGLRLYMNWATAFMPLTCAALMHRLGAWRWQAVRTRDVLVGFASMQALLLAVTWATSTHGVPALNQHKSRSFASQWLADTIGPAARTALGGPVRVIAGPQQLASVLALRLQERPLVLVNGNFELSPWIEGDVANRCGVLWVGRQGDAMPYDVDAHPFGDGLWWAAEVGTHPEACR